MYIPEVFEERDVATLHRLIVTHPLGALVTVTTGGLDANHIPFLVDADRSRSEPCAATSLVQTRCGELPEVS